MANVALGFFVPGRGRATSCGPSSCSRSSPPPTWPRSSAAGSDAAAGQEEAAQALGLAGGTTFLIVLPQALRNVIPAQVGQFISLFKDTTSGRRGDGAVRGAPRRPG